MKFKIVADSSCDLTKDYIIDEDVVVGKRKGGIGSSGK